MTYSVFSETADRVTRLRWQKRPPNPLEPERQQATTLDPQKEVEMRELQTMVITKEMKKNATVLGLNKSFSHIRGGFSKNKIKQPDQKPYERGNETPNSPPEFPTLRLFSKFDLFRVTPTAYPDAEGPQQQQSKDPNFAYSAFTGWSGNCRVTRTRH